MELTRSASRVKYSDVMTGWSCFNCMMLHQDFADHNVPVQVFLNVLAGLD